MTEYKVVFRADQTKQTLLSPLWEKGCPLLVEAVQVSRNVKNSKAYLQIKLRNISNEMINSFEAIAHIDYAKEDPEETHLSYLDADIPAGSTKTLNAVSLKNSDVESATVTILECKDSSTHWKTSNPSQPIPLPITLDLPDELLDERAKLIWGDIFTSSSIFNTLSSAFDTPAEKEREQKLASKYKQMQNLSPVIEDNWWVCACGQVNLNREKCLSCKTKLSQMTKPELNDKGFLKDSKEKRTRDALEKSLKQDQKHKRIKKVLLITLLAVLLVFAVIFGILQQKQFTYNEACDALNSGNYAEAVEKFSSLGDYQDAPLMLEKAQYEDASVDFENGNYTTAVEKFSLLGDYPGASTKLKKAQLMEKISPHMGESIPTVIVVDILGFSQVDAKSYFTINSDGTCIVEIPKNENNVHSGTWQGTWNKATLGLTLPEFPVGEKWQIEAENTWVDRFSDMELTNLGIFFINKDLNSSSFMAVSWE